MKIVEKEIKREIEASKAAVLWNYWDHEHLYVIHQNYTNAHVIYEDERTGIYALTYKLPIFSFLRSHSLNVMIQNDHETIKAFNLGLFGIPTATTITIKEIRKDYCSITMNYKFLLFGWREIFAPFLPAMIEKWNTTVWLEDLPLKLRRQKVMRYGFKDFMGLPDKVEDRCFEGEIPFELPVKKHKESPVNLPL